MMFQWLGNRLQVRLESGEKVTESLTRLLEAEGIGYAALTGLGAVRHVRVAYLNVDTREYEPHEVEEQMELVSLVGNATLRDEKPFLHLHAALGRRDLSMFGGHLQEAVAHPTVEVWLSPEDGNVRRVFDESVGMALMQLPGRLSG
jgi:uncharacterized protein